MVSRGKRPRKARAQRAELPMTSLQLLHSRARHIDLLPGLIRIEQVNALGDAVGTCSEILLVDGTGMIDHEGHDAGISVLRGICDQRESADHLALDDVVERTARRIRSRPLQYPEVIAVIGRRSLASPVALGRGLRRERTEGARVAIVTPEQPILLAGRRDDALSVDAYTFAAVLVSIFILGIDKGESRLDRVELVAADTAIEHLNAAFVGVELPSGLCVDKRNREREVVRAQHQ